MNKHLTFFILSFFVALLILEPILRFTKLYNTKAENSIGEYQYFFQDFGNSWFHTHTPNTTVNQISSEFSYENVYNELGHREKSFTLFKDDSSSFKIICLGDSYTEGDGAPYDSSWVKILENELNKQNQNVSLYNAGVNGSDILFNYMMLKEKLLSSQPKMVIECINRSDVLDIYNKGGLERFNNDGTLNFPNKKPWEMLYKYSHVFRAALSLFTSYNVNLINLKTMAEEEENALRIIANQAFETHSLCASKNISYLLIIAPNVSTLNKEYLSNFTKIGNLLNPNLSYIDIHSCMENEFKSKDLKAYSWEENNHFNSKGYELMTNCILENYQFIIK